MPFRNVRGADIDYEGLCNRGPSVALSPDGRRSLDEFFSVAEKLSRSVYRLLLHGR
jgi:hypothetical protein